MINTLNFARRALRGGTALQALALMGAGVGMVAVAAPASAQDYSQVNATGRIQGTNGEAISGASVTVTSNDQGFTRTVTTGGDGSYRVPSLPQGSYTFTIEAPGFDSFTDNAVTLTQGGSANQFTLAPTGTAAAGGDIVVTAGRVQTVDFDRNTTGAVINIGELATRVPVARDITSVVLLSPGTLQGDTAFGNLPNIAGASVSENTYYINGLNITNFFTGLGGAPVPFELYQTVEVKNGGISAEFGRTTGGFVNATTKSGSNEFHGGVLFNWEPDDLREKPRNTYATDNDSSYSERKDFIAQLSGPIIKDHLFFYGLYNAREVRTGGGFSGIANIGATAAVPADGELYPAVPANTGLRAVRVGTQYIRDANTSPFYAGKIDAVIVDGQRLEFTYFNTESTTRRDIFGTAASGRRFNVNTNDPGNYVSTTLFRLGGENYVGRYTGTFTDWFTLSGAYGRNYIRDTTESSTPGVASVIDQRSGTSNQIANPTANSTLAFGRREFYRADADLYVKLLGNHHFRGGYDRENLRADSTTTANGTYQYTLFNSGASGDSRVTTPNTQYFQRRYFANGGIFTTRGEAYYLQDQWTLFSNRLALNLGVRNDRFINKNSDGDTFFNSGDNWAPRLGFSFDPVGDSRTKVYGSFSRYFLPVATNTNIRLAGSELDYDQFYTFSSLGANNVPVIGSPINVRGGNVCPALAVDPATIGGQPARNCVLRSDGTTPPFLSLVDQKLKAQSRDEWILGFEQRIGSRWKVGAFYTQRDLNESLEDAYIDAGVRAYCQREFSSDTARRTSCLDIFSGFHQYALLNPGSDVTVLLDGVLTGDTAARTVTLRADDLGLPKAEAHYKSMTFTIDREFDGKWSISANYTLSALVGNIEGGVRSDNGQTDSGLTTAFDFPALTYGAYGYLPPHRRHNLKIYGSYQLLDALNLGANFQLTSPRKFGCIGRVPTAVDGGFAENYNAAGYYCNVNGQGQVITTGTGINTNNSGQLTPRGRSFQSDWLYNLGLDVALRIPTDAFDGTLRLSVFNVLNSKAELDFQEVGTTAAGAPSALYQQPLTYQAPRTFRLQFGVNF